MAASLLTPISKPFLPSSQTHISCEVHVVGLHSASLSFCLCPHLSRHFSAFLSASAFFLTFTMQTSDQHCTLSSLTPSLTCLSCPQLRLSYLLQQTQNLLLISCTHDSPLSDHQLLTLPFTPLVRRLLQPHAAHPSTDLSMFSAYD